MYAILGRQAKPRVLIESEAEVLRFRWRADAGKDLTCLCLAEEELARLGCSQCSQLPGAF